MAYWQSGRIRGSLAVLLDGAADRRKDVVCIGANQADCAHYYGQDYRQHHCVLRDILSIISQYSMQSVLHIDLVAYHKLGPTGPFENIPQS